MKGLGLPISSYALPYKGRLFVVTILILLGIGFNLVKPWPLKLIIDGVLSDRLESNKLSWLESLPGANIPQILVAWLIGATVLLFIAQEIVKMAQNYLQAIVGDRMTYDLTTVVFDRLQYFSLRFHHQQQVGNLVRKVTQDTTCIRELVIEVAIPLLTSLVSLAAMFAIMWQLDSFLSLITLAIAPLIVLLIKYFNQPMIEYSYQHQQLEGEMMALSEQTLSALPVIQAFNCQPYQEQNFRQLSQQTLKTYLSSIISQLQFKIGVGFATALGTVLIMIVGGINVLQGSLSLGSLLIFFAYLDSLYSPLETLTYLASGFAIASGKARRVAEILHTEVEINEPANAPPLPTNSNGERKYVRLENVTFGYSENRPVLNNISLSIYPGEKLALVGATGAGKSTLVGLIPRFFDPWQGKVFVNGVDISQVQLASLRSQMSMVLQEPFLLPLTVAQNIAYGSPHATHKQIVESAIVAEADQFIRQLPQGYNTLLNERGIRLSGGERQRLAIARALLKDAPLLILDEPTSALDAQTEQLTLQALEHLMAGRTTITIAQRLSTIRQADRIVVLDQGKIVEMGTHQDLLSGKGYYYHLHQSQFGHTWKNNT